MIFFQRSKHFYKVQIQNQKLRYNCLPMQYMFRILKEQEVCQTVFPMKIRLIQSLDFRFLRLVRLLILLMINQK